MHERPLSGALDRLFNYQVRFQRHILWIIKDMYMEYEAHGFDPELLAIKEFSDIADFFLLGVDDQA